MKLLHGLVVFLSLMLLFAPPSGAVCWLLPDGRHLHIGWNDPNGDETPGLNVFTHRTSQTVGDPRAPSLGLASLSEPPVSGVLLLPITVWFLPLVTLAWLLLAQTIFPSVWQPRPTTPPPRRATSL